MIGYKYWIFYILPEYYEQNANDIPVIIDENSYIYAYTDNKDYADQFELCHDMRYFKRKKFILTSDQIHELTLTERNKYLKMQCYSTKNAKGYVKHIDLILTMDELYAVEEASRNYIMKLSLKMNLESPNIFRGGLQHALFDLKYFNFWRYQMGWMSSTGAPFDPMTFHIEMDDLMVYTKLFGMLLKGGGM